MNLVISLSFFMLTSIAVDSRTTTTITPLRFFLKQLFTGRKYEVAESGIVEPFEVTDSPKWASKKKAVQTIDLRDFLSNNANSDEDADDLSILEKPKGLFASLFSRRGKKSDDDRVDNDDEKETTKGRQSFLSNVLRALRDSSRSSFRSIFKSLFPAMFASST